MASKWTTTAGFDLDTYFVAQRARIDTLLDQILPASETEPVHLHEAMRYALLSGGKRIRPILLLATYRLFASNDGPALQSAAAVEMVHTASLILDDLPCMDDAAVRRNQACCHKVYGESTAILAAVNLLNRAFGLIVEDSSLPGTVARHVQIEMARAIGSNGLIGGQWADLDAAQRQALSLEQVESVHRRKTGALFVAAVRIGACIGGADTRQTEALDAYARNLGLAFQITDDILDLASDAAVPGESSGRVTRRLSFLCFCTVRDARTIVRDLVRTSVASLRMVRHDTSVLEAIAQYVAARDQ